MKIDPVKYYYKDPETGVEMNFTKTDMWGWAVGFPKMSITESFNYGGKIPFPVLSEKEQQTVNDNYRQLKEQIESGEIYEEEEAE